MSSWLNTNVIKIVNNGNAVRDFIHVCDLVEAHYEAFKKVRDAHKTENTEDYLEIIAELLNSKGEARIVDIANELDIAQATANKTIQRLQNQGFVKKEPYRSIFLTLKGQELASISKKRHIVVLTFLKKLGIDPRTAEADAEGIEHHVSDKTLKKMEQFNKKN